MSLSILALLVPIYYLLPTYPAKAWWNIAILLSIFTLTDDKVNHSELEEISHV